MSHAFAAVFICGNMRHLKAKRNNCLWHSFTYYYYYYYYYYYIDVVAKC